MTTAHLLLDSWAGRRRVPVEVIGETPTRYRVRLEQGALLPRRGYCDAGTVLLAPKHAVVIDKETDRERTDPSQLERCERPPRE